MRTGIAVSRDAPADHASPQPDVDLRVILLTQSGPCGPQFKDRVREKKSGLASADMITPCSRNLPGEAASNNLADDCQRSSHRTCFSTPAGRGLWERRVETKADRAATLARVSSGKCISAKYTVPDVTPWSPINLQDVRTSCGARTVRPSTAWTLWFVQRIAAKMK